MSVMSSHQQMPGVEHWSRSSMIFSLHRTQMLPVLTFKERDTTTYFLRDKKGSHKKLLGGFLYVKGVAPCTPLMENFLPKNVGGIVGYLNLLITNHLVKREASICLWINPARISASPRTNAGAHSSFHASLGSGFDLGEWGREF